MSARCLSHDAEIRKAREETREQAAEVCEDAEVVSYEFGGASHVDGRGTIGACADAIRAMPIEPGDEAAE